MVRCLSLWGCVVCFVWCGSSLCGGVGVCGVWCVVVGGSGGVPKTSSMARRMTFEQRGNKIARPKPCLWVGVVHPWLLSQYNVLCVRVCAHTCLKACLLRGCLCECVCVCVCVCVCQTHSVIFFIYKKP